MKNFGLLMAIVGIAAAATTYGQGTGTIKGTLTDEKGANMPFVTVALVEDSTIIEGITTDDNGDFTFKELTPGFYELRFSFLGYRDKSVRGVEVSNNQIAYVYKKMNLVSTELGPVEVFSEKWEKPIINSTYSTVTNITIDQIENIAAPKNDVIAVLTAVTPGVFATADGKDIYIRGSRRGTTAYYIDGNKILGSPEVPGLGISGMEILTGGVPAEYGDCTGGLVIITTKDYKTEMRRKRMKETNQKEKESVGSSFQSSEDE
jgi:hypothetical protein